MLDSDFLLELLPESQPFEANNNRDSDSSVAVNRDSSIALPKTFSVHC